MQILPRQVERLVEEFSKLPGIGPKSASRLVFYLLKSSDEDLQGFATAVGKLKESLTTCSSCFNIAETNPCVICKDTERDSKILCVVEEPLDVVAMEQTRGFHGLYHVLGGVISPLNNVRPQDLRIQELVNRVATTGVSEIIIATNPNLEGEATAMYISAALKEHSVRLSKLAGGLPVGSDLEYTDQLTLSLALENRKEFKGSRN